MSGSPKDWPGHGDHSPAQNRVTSSSLRGLTPCKPPVLMNLSDLIVGTYQSGRSGY